MFADGRPVCRLSVPADLAEDIILGDLVSASGINVTAILNGVCNVFCYASSPFVCSLSIGAISRSRIPHVRFPSLWRRNRWWIAHQLREEWFLSG